MSTTSFCTICKKDVSGLSFENNQACEECSKNCYVISLQMKKSKEWSVLGVRNTREEAENEAQKLMSKFPIFNSYKIEKTNYLERNQETINNSEEIKSLNPKEVKELVSSTSNIQLLDVREKHEIKNDLILNAINIEVKEIPHKVNDLSKEKTYIVYCTAGYRSPYVCEFLQERGFKTYDLRGGLLGWKGAGFVVPVIEGTFKLLNKLRK
ncbi:rhodanese-like domain-containing protein [Priestia flexa]|uniref:rhodanese-like domain-containing protein n=1 Tax=Priestia flexa TaxID=86664 RepID=UPI002204B598|nr:rhodanese-like domain-containing protein [Bacillus sp. 1780r2a1]